MPTVHDVAGYLLWLADRDRSGIDHLKLQKLVYYAQAFHLGSEAEPLFNDSLHAWRYGLVSPELWSQYRYRRGNIEPPDASGAETLTDRQREGGGAGLRALSGPLRHRVGAPHARGGPLAAGNRALPRRRDDIVTHEQMRLYYRNRLAVLAESAEFPPLEPVIDLGSLGDVAAGILPRAPSAP